MSLLSTLQVKEKSRCFSVCGSGGKSSLCHALALESIRKGKKTVITTTTHIARPDFPEAEVFFSEDSAELKRIFRAGYIPVAGKLDGEKFCFGGEKQLCLLKNEADMIFIEADGANRFPLKFPNGREPVISEQTDEVIVVCGLSAFGKLLNKVCHRVSLAREALPDLKEIADTDAIASILWKGYGRFDPIFVLNQADSDSFKVAGVAIQKKLESYGARCVSIVSLKNLGYAEKSYF